MKFDMGQAWDTGMAMARSNWQLLIVIAGLFLFLPSAIVGLVMPQAMMGMTPGADPEAMAAQLSGMMGAFFAYAFIAFILQTLGYMVMMTLLADPGRPTVGESITKNLPGLLTIIGAAILAYLGLTILLLVIMIPVALLAGGLSAASGDAGAAAAGVGVALLLIPFMFAAMLYFGARLSMTMPVVVLEGERNPITALMRSWRITGANVWRLALFYFLLFLAYMVIALVFQMMIGGALVLAIGTTGMSITVILTSVIGAAFSILFTAIVAAIYRQLSGDGDATAFE